MAFGTILAFWAVSFLFVITPGADWAYVIAGGLRDRIAPAVGGLLTGHVIATIVVAAGVGALVAGAPVILTMLTVAGAGYLIWLGVSTLRRPAVPIAESGGSEGSWLRWATKGIGVSGLNPKLLLLFLALLPPFTTPTAVWPVALQIAVLGAVHVLSCAVVYTGVGFGARAVLRSRPAASRWVSRVSGSAMIVIGLVLIVERIVF
ncbi:LysE family translocator [Leifsonia poae]|uniref:LysE family translocator n=1 Tax=Leifsonia poae TaxID=110933 RepID=UPI001CBD3E5E|nr:LysE family translocator [Leifsonia poae]